MIIPIRCFNCGKVLADLWNPYIEKLQVNANVESLSKKSDKTPECTTLDELGVKKYCCRTIMMSTVDLTEKIFK